MKILIILNDPPYGTERSYNGLRLANALGRHATDVTITIFLMADAVLCAKRGQKTAEGYYNIEHMLARLLAGGHGEVLLCGTCMNARGVEDTEVIGGARRSTMDELAQATLGADKVLVF